MVPIVRKIRWGVLGYAKIARESLIPAIRRSSNSEFYALGSRDGAKLGEFRQRFPDARAYGSYEELLGDPQVDAVYIPLPNSLHREWTIKAAEQGKHVLCEKPLALTAGEAREMIAACAAHGVTLMEAFMYRYTGRTRQVRAALRSGVLGEIKFVGATFRFLLENPASIKWQPALGGGALYDVGCYPVNFAGLVADEIGGGGPGSSRPESVQGVSVLRGGVDEIFSGSLRYPSGLIASVECGFNACRRVSAEIVGTRGVLEIADTFFDNPGSLILTLGDARREIPVAASDRYVSEVEDFADSILQHRPPQLPLAESLRNLEVLERLYAASRA